MINTKSMVCLLPRVCLILQKNSQNLNSIKIVCYFKATLLYTATYLVMLHKMLKLVVAAVMLHVVVASAGAGVCTL